MNLLKSAWIHKRGLCNSIINVHQIFYILILPSIIAAASSSSTSLSPKSTSTAITKATTTSTTSSISINHTKCLDNLTNLTHSDQHNGFSTIEHIDGDFVLSIFTIELMPSTVVLNRINDILGGDLTIGLRIININANLDKIKNILLDEIEYLEQCEENPIGIVIMNDLWPHVSEIVKEVEYNIWKLPTSASLVFPKVAHLLYELPWNEDKFKRQTIFDVKTKSMDVATDFLNIAESEHLCLIKNNNSSNDIIGNIVQIVIGNEMLSVENYLDSSTIFALPLSGSFEFIRDLPNGSYAFIESEINTKTRGEQKPIRKSFNKFRISTFLTLSSTLLDLAKWINGSVVPLCRAEELKLNECKNVTMWNPFQIKPNDEMLIELLKELNFEDRSDELNVDLIQKIVTQINGSDDVKVDLRQIASINVISNVTTFYHYKDQNFTSINNRTKLGQYYGCKDAKIANGTSLSINRKKTHFIDEYYVEMYWRVKPDAWIAAGLTVSVLGILISFVILIFIIVRIYMEDILEGNPMGTIMLLISLILMFISFLPFSIEYTSDRSIVHKNLVSLDVENTLCSVRIFLVTICYCITFSLILCRALMLAAIGSEGGFLSHVNGYVQSVICLFSTLVQMGLSTQLIIIMHTAQKSISCDNIYYGYWFWILLAYDACLLFFLVLLSPFIVRSQRNYKEGVLIITGSILCLVVWGIWIPLANFGDYWRDIAIPLGIQGTGWAILGGILVPRCFLIVRGIARSDLAQALPSLTSLAFAHNNQYVSEQSIYECVNPAMRQHRVSDDLYSDRCQSPSEIPTLPLRGASRKNQNPLSYAGSDQSTLPVTPSKATRF